MATISGGKCILAAISKSQTNPSIELDSAAVHWPVLLQPLDIRIGHLIPLVFMESTSPRLHLT